VWFAIDTHDGLIEVMWAKSIAFSKMDEEEFRETTSRVFDVIYEETGLDVEEHYRIYLQNNPKLKVEPKRSVRGAG
jgi:hypothetical protein